MADFGAAADFVAETLNLEAPGRDGKAHIYKIPWPDVETLMRLYAVREIASRKPGDPPPERELTQLAGLTFASQLEDSLTPAIVAAMGTDGVPTELVRRAASAALYYFTGNAGVAEMIWSGKVTPRETPKEPTGDADDSTQSPASTSGTSTRKKSKSK